MCSISQVICSIRNEYEKRGKARKSNCKIQNILFNEKSLRIPLHFLSVFSMPALCPSPFHVRLNVLCYSSKTQVKYVQKIKVRKINAMS